MGTEDKWELFNVAEDFSMSTDVSEKYPVKMAVFSQVRQNLYLCLNK